MSSAVPDMSFRIQFSTFDNNLGVIVDAIESSDETGEVSSGYLVLYDYAYIFALRDAIDKFITTRKLTPPSK